MTVIAFVTVCAALVLANNAGLIPRELAGQLTVGLRNLTQPHRGAAAPPPAVEPPPRAHPAPEPPARRAPDAPAPQPAREPATRLPARVEPPTPTPAPEPTLKPPAREPEVRPPARDRPAKPPATQAPARPATVRQPGLLTPDERRERLANLAPPPGFTAEWMGGAAALSVAANEVARGRTNHRRVAITIDGAYEDRLAPAMLEVLRSQGVRATFFLTGGFARSYPSAVRQMAAAGHEIGNHSQTHPALTKLSDERALAEVEGAEKHLLALAGPAYRPYFRPPFGDRNVRVLRLLIQRGYLPVYWTVDSLDWKEDATAEGVLERLLPRGQEPGAILLLHAGSEATLQALPRLLARLRDADLAPGPLSAVLQP